MNKRLLACLLLLLGIGFAPANGWDYTDPEEWPTDYPDCGGDRQSPINLLTDASTFNNGLDMTFNNYLDRDTGDFTVTNNGHTLVVTVATDSAITLQHGLLPNTYTLEQFHFHWGSDDTKGSEHAIDGTLYPMEIHLVHYNSDDYSSVSEAANQDGGLAVVGIFVEVDNQILGINEIDDLISHFSDVPYEGDTTTMPSFAINALFPNRYDYFRYPGSLTTPPCYESVYWSVLDTAIEFTPEQIDAFRNLHSNVQGDPDTFLVDNSRPIQLQNGRVVMKSFR